MLASMVGELIAFMFWCLLAGVVAIFGLMVVVECLRHAMRRK